MNKITKIALSLTMLTSPAFADTIEILTYYKPGGGTDQQIQIAKPLIEAQGHTVNVQFCNFVFISNSNIKFFVATNFNFVKRF